MDTYNFVEKMENILGLLLKMVSLKKKFRLYCLHVVYV
ncbi:ATP synthase subunit beta [Clostridium botulinum]|uniref:ATP synthase subunit beta n=2 Tax=Clostridium botulinum TaxID=1491 RepID=A0A846I4U0_CLOBO|nr:hypothetical protein CLJ_B2096 [Clostridium botulinum Ba4 str. 657]AUN01653.1 ATP synthase subunit beta [Clostridium botulinum]EDT83743.1 hypothetical protein CBB_2162 [Clostridium botulinum Bf]AUN05135.1 ATP synthase subunit beta [Clostridium botulinum]AXG94072.1 ATP synthase subunit beta [Clostridium botulinum]